MDEIEKSSQPALACPVCSTPMQYRKERIPVFRGESPTDVFYCRTCKTEIQRPRKRLLVP
jgi:hypothetical protein